MQGKALGREKRVMEEACTIYGSDGDAAHIGVSRYVIQVVEGKDAAREGLQKPYPFRFAMVFLAIFLNRERDILRTQLLAWIERATGTAPQLVNNLTEMVLDDDLSEILVGQVVCVEEIVIEKMAEGSMSHVVKKPCPPHVFFNKGSRRTLVANHFLERRIKMFGEFARHVHGTKRVLKAAMFSRGIDPPGALQLINVTQSLHPGGVNERFFGFFRFV